MLRKGWAIHNYGLLTNPQAAVASIDEKWFYRTSRCWKLKVLKLGPHEKEGADKIVFPKMLSRRFPIKSMFMGVVGRPIPHRNFDGKILLERVSKKRYISKCTAHSNFSDDAIINAEIKMGKWKIYVTDLHICIAEIRDIFYLNYELDDAIIDRLEFGYNTKIGNNGNEKYVRIEDDGSKLFTKKIRRMNDSNLPSLNLKIEDIKAQVRYKIGDEIEEDASCNSSLYSGNQRYFLVK